MAKTNIFEKEQRADIVAQYMNPNFDWDGFSAYRRAKSGKKSLRKEALYWAKRFLSSLGTLVFAPVFLGFGLITLFGVVLGWNAQLSALFGVAGFVLAAVNNAKEFSETACNMRRSFGEYIDAVRIVKNAPKE